MVIWVTTPPVRKSQSASVHQLNSNEYNGFVLHSSVLFTRQHFIFLFFFPHMSISFTHSVQLNSS